MQMIGQVTDERRSPSANLEGHDFSGVGNAATMWAFSLSFT
jgi:hypothetical protein